MPLIAYQGAHGANDFPLHFSFFEALERRRLLDRYEFALDPFHDNSYCQALIRRFPQLVLSTTSSSVSRLREYARRRVGRGLRIISSFESRFDAICEGPGGRIHPHYSGARDIFWRYPRTTRRAILFHSVEPGILEQPETRNSVASADLVIARNRQSAAIARRAGAPRIIESSDIVFSRAAESIEERAGFAVALRVPNVGTTTEFLDEIRSILDYLETLGRPVDLTPIEAPLNEELANRGYHTKLHPHVTLSNAEAIYDPFNKLRNGIISCRLHTTICAIIAGNRNILQFQVESGTSKISEIFRDIGLESLQVYPIDNLRLHNVQEFVEQGNVLDDAEVARSLITARALVDTGLDAFQEWLAELG